MTLVVPAGVDSAVAAHADSVADQTFVPLQQQDQATALQDTGVVLVTRSDSLWQAFDRVHAAADTVVAADSVRASDLATDGGRALVQLDRTLRESDLEADALMRQTAQLLDSAEAALEAAFVLNPFDTRSRLWLARVYELQARRLGEATAYGRAVDELEKLAQLTPDQHAVFAMLANNYFRLENWERAAESYARAEHVYWETYDLAADAPGTLDSTVVYGYARAEADMHVRRLDAARATTAFATALAHAPTADDSAYVIGELEWMAWDDMNVASSFARDSLTSLEQAGELEPARNGYRDLLPRLSARRAIDETEWRLAVVDYNIGNAVDAVERLQRLVTRLPVDSLGVPLDSTHARYLNDYGTVCLNLARDFLHTRRDNRTALMYLEQAARVVWLGRPVAHLEIATLVQNNTDLALENAQQALTGEIDLTIDQRRELYRLLSSLYRRTGAFDDARRYRDLYRDLQGG